MLVGGGTPSLELTHSPNNVVPTLFLFSNFGEKIFQDKFPKGWGIDYIQHFEYIGLAPNDLLLTECEIALPNPIPNRILVTRFPVPSLILYNHLNTVYTFSCAGVAVAGAPGGVGSSFGGIGAV